ncbi:Increased recombination centers protein 22 [Yarrowia sp. C11]|nr:Increased recombination centers protein 22 [Yarrowia sp. C11]KAG5370790.1 Increased recombination centers protein 22 [Yarrowia sp. E02]
MKLSLVAVAMALASTASAWGKKAGPVEIPVASHLSFSAAAQIGSNSDVAASDAGFYVANTYVNGEDVPIELTFTNNEKDAISVVAVGGTFYDLKTDKIVASVQGTQVGPIVVESGKTGALTHQFETRLDAKVYRNVIQVYIQHGNEVYQVHAFDGPVVIVDPHVSPLSYKFIIAQVVLGITAAALGYYVVTSYAIPYATGTYGQEKKPVRAKPVAPAGSGVKMGPKGYDESWIPKHHLQQEKAKKKE